MASGYGVSPLGRGRGLRKNDHHTMALKYQNVKEESHNADIENPFGVTQEPWSFYQASCGNLDKPISTDFKFGDDNQLLGEKRMNFQQNRMTKNVMDILSGTCSYLTDTDNMSTSSFGDADDQIYPLFSDPYISSISVTAKHSRQPAAAATTSTNSVKNEKPSAHTLKENPTNKLEKISKCSKLPAPSYVMVSTTQAAQGFVAVCEFLEYVETGFGNSQNEAREEAAIKMLEKLRIEGDSTSEYDCGFQNSFQYNVIKDEDQKGLQDRIQNKSKASHLYSNLREHEHCQRYQFQQKSDSDSHYSLPEFSLRPTGNKQYVWLLQSIASKMNFEVRYESVPHRTSNSLAQCLVHICKDPPVVCYGSAKSENKAKSSAARCAFEYLKTIYQK